MGWTEERVETLKTLWLDGLSASQIAKQLGGVTRNAVIGKVHRLGLSGRATPSQPSAALRPARAPRPLAPMVQRRTPVVTEPRRQPPTVPAIDRIEERGGATVLTLGAHMCKWPIGDPSSSEFTFCGRRSQDERPYCIEHARLAYQPTQSGKRKATASELARSLRRYI